MPPKMKERSGGSGGVLDKPRDQLSLVVAFAKQIKRIRCPICKEEFAAGVLPAHRRECMVREDDDECQIIMVQTAEEKWAAGLITIDGESESPTTSGAGKIEPIKRTTKRKLEEGKDNYHSPSEMKKEAEQLQAAVCVAVSQPAAAAAAPTNRVTRSRALALSQTSEKEEMNAPSSMSQSSSLELETGCASPSSMEIRTACESEVWVAPSQGPEMRRTRGMIREDERRKEDTVRKQREERKKERERKGEGRRKETEGEEEDEEEEEEEERPIEGMTKILLRALNDKCLRHEKGLIPSQVLVQEPVISLEEEDPEVVPHYVYLTCLIMKRVLSAKTADGRVHDERFWGEDLRLMSRFLSLRDGSKLLFVRLFTRKRAWHAPEKIREKYNYVENGVDEALRELIKYEFLEDGKTVLRRAEEVLWLCSIEKLRMVAKDVRVNFAQPKVSLVPALLKAATQQRRLDFLSGDTTGNSERLLLLAKKYLGSVYRTSNKANMLFRALFTLYSPTQTDSTLVAEDQTINIMSHMMFRMKEIHYDLMVRKAPFPCDLIIGVYATKEELYEYVAVKESEERLLRARPKDQIEEGMVEAERARERLASLDKTRKEALAALPPHQRQFTTEAVLARFITRGVDSLQKSMKYPAACNWIKFVTNSEVVSSLIPHSVGELYERLALNLHYHCANSEDAVDEIKNAFENPLVPEKNRLNLDERAKRILKENWQSRFDLLPAKEIIIEGETVGRDLGDGRVNRFVRKDERGDVQACSVEQVALDYFLSHGMEEGVHSEGEIWHVAFKLLFWDVIYAHDVADVWLCELQDSPLDFNYSLYDKRKSQFEERFQWIKDASMEAVLQRIEQFYAKNLQWSMKISEIKSFVMSCPPCTLLAVLHILAQHPRHRRSGFPDLVLWNKTNATIMVSEVKGPGDSLSSKQKLWLDFFMRDDSGRVQTLLCKVTASGRKRLH